MKNRRRKSNNQTEAIEDYRGKQAEALESLQFSEKQLLSIKDFI